MSIQAIDSTAEGLNLGRRVPGLAKLADLFEVPLDLFPGFAGFICALLYQQRIVDVFPDITMKGQVNRHRNLPVGVIDNKLDTFHAFILADFSAHATCGNGAH